MGYRLMAAGAVFIPEREARSLHQGPATFMSRAAEVRRLNQPNFANFVPVPGRFRPWKPGRQYAVPRVDVIVDGTGESFEAAEECIDAVLASDEMDLRLDFCCAERNHEMSLLEAVYRDDVRVQIRDDMPATGFPSSYTMFIPEWARLGVNTLGALIERIEADVSGFVRVNVPSAAGEDGTIILWRTAALHRARRAVGGEGDVLATADRLFGSSTVAGVEVGVVDARHQQLQRLPNQRPSTLALMAELRETKQELRRVRRRYRDLVARQRARAAAETKSAAPSGGLRPKLLPRFGGFRIPGSS
jgi:hypothetical protein